MRRPFWSTLAALAAATTAWILGATPALAYPPTPPSASTAQTQLNSLTVRTEGSTTGYSRDLFPHWSTVSGTCDTRSPVRTPGRRHAASSSPTTCSGRS